jgi:hypothetical protein
MFNKNVFVSLSLSSLRFLVFFSSTLKRNKDIDYLPFPICRKQVRALTQGLNHEPLNEEDETELASSNQPTVIKFKVEKKRQHSSQKNHFLTIKEFVKIN